MSVQIIAREEVFGDPFEDEYEAACRWAEQEFQPAVATTLSEAIQRKDANTFHATFRDVSVSLSLHQKALAIWSRNLKFLELLLEHDNTLDDGIMTLACEQKDREAITLLLKSGWPINQLLLCHASPLWKAVDDLELMKWMLQQGADPCARSADLDESVLSIAIAHGSMDVVDFLFDRETDFTDGDLLHHAARRRDYSEGAEIVARLSAYNLDVNAYRYHNPKALRWRWNSLLPTPLHIACEMRNFPVAQALLQQGANPNAKMLDALEETSPTPLEFVKAGNDDESTRLLMSTQEERA